MFEIASTPLSRRAALAGLFGVSALGLAACAGSNTGGGGNGASATPVSSDDFAKAMDTETELTFWTWVPDIQNEVDGVVIRSLQPSRLRLPLERAPFLDHDLPPLNAKPSK